MVASGTSTPTSITVVETTRSTWSQLTGRSSLRPSPPPDIRPCNAVDVRLRQAASCFLENVLDRALPLWFRLRIIVGILGIDARAHDEHPVTCLDLLTSAFPQPTDVRGLMRSDRPRAWRPRLDRRALRQRGNIEVTENGHRHGARNRCGRHDQHVRMGAVGGAAGQAPHVAQHRNGAARR